ncbi:MULTISPECIES: hypothetical protein [unclassified Coleofasciculus]|uniref:hypothetical protein n=1 Tax=unclassified Coleofasciculus TaxID=2692782 RepID=UPI00188116F9|nr:MULTISPECIES: hypothetical protein [unclassified Coleofasciculus]MBE9126474.1 hypothetical protein [Coleofasciculus sp. LEGE 07081]MBE9148912.1 hypothetical protein [Coleofasciculus sp. LEGE 07092]
MSAQSQHERRTRHYIPWLLSRVLFCLSLGLTVACQAEPPSGVNSLEKPAVASSRSIATIQVAQIQPSSRDSQNTYQSQPLGVSFEYPKGFIVDDTNEEPETGMAGGRGTLEVWTQADYQAIQTTEFEGTELPANVSISVYRNPNRLSLQEWVESRSDYFVSPQNYTRQKVADQDAIAFQSTGLYEFENVLLPSLDGKDIIVINLARGSGNESAYQQVFEQILATLQPLP